MNLFELVFAVFERFPELKLQREDVAISIGRNQADWQPLFWEEYNPSSHDPYLSGEWMPRVDVVVTATPIKATKRVIFGEWQRLTPQSPALAIWEARDLIRAAANEAGLGVGIYHLTVR